MREADAPAGENLVSVVLDVAAVREATLKNAAVGTFGRESGALLEACADRLRTVSYLLHSPLLDELGLERALHLYIGSFSKRTGIPVTFNAPEDLENLDTETELTLFRIVQEGLANVAQHSQSPASTVEIQRKPNLITIEISDQGVGMLGHMHKNGGGIADMRARVQALQGSFMIDTSSQGTSILVALPIQDLRAHS